ncbi:MAG: hypothetical protein ACYC99_05140 [Candidatus Geothermincolia bacterium]
MSESEIKCTPEDPGLLHLYGQAGYHDEAFMVGNTKGLQALRDAIDKVLGGETDQCIAWVADCDGEWYDLKVMRVDDPWSMNFKIGEDGEIESWSPGAPDGSRWNRIALPYSDEDWGKERREDALWPAKFWKYEGPLPPTTGTVAYYISAYLQKSVSGLPLVDEGCEIECPHCGEMHPTSVVDGKEGEKLLVYVCLQTNGENELVAAISEGEKFRLVTSLLKDG